MHGLFSVAENKPAAPVVLVLGDDPRGVMFGTGRLLRELRMTKGRVELADGLDVWVWYPAMDRDYSDPKTVQAALAEWGAVFQRLPRIDAVFVPGGDPGHTQPKHLMAWLG